jgi:hypothetical protein
MGRINAPTGRLSVIESRDEKLSWGFPGSHGSHSLSSVDWSVYDSCAGEHCDASILNETGLLNLSGASFSSKSFARILTTEHTEPTEKNIFDNLSFTYSLNSDAVVSLRSELRVEDGDLCGKKRNTPF